MSFIVRLNPNLLDLITIYGILSLDANYLTYILTRMKLLLYQVIFLLITQSSKIFLTKVLYQLLVSLKILNCSHLDQLLSIHLVNSMEAQFISQIEENAFNIKYAATMQNQIQ